MKSYPIAKSRRVRSTPYTSRIENQGVTAYTVYNHMLLPAAFGSLEESCDHLKKNVQVWDVSAERQVEIFGDDAAKLVQLMTCRDLSKSKIGRCYYCPIIDENGNLVNDPVILKLAEDRWWISIADSDVIFFAKGLASGNNFKVKIFEPSVDILAVQGPKSFDLMEKIFGKSIKELKVLVNKEDYNSIKNHLKTLKEGLSIEFDVDEKLQRGDIVIKSGDITLEEINSKKIKLSNDSKIDLSVISEDG